MGFRFKREYQQAALDNVIQGPGPMHWVVDAQEAWTLAGVRTRLHTFRDDSGLRVQTTHLLTGEKQ